MNSLSRPAEKINGDDVSLAAEGRDVWLAEVSLSTAASAGSAAGWGSASGSGRDDHRRQRHRKEESWPDAHLGFFCHRLRWSSPLIMPEALGASANARLVDVSLTRLSSPRVRPPRRPRRRCGNSPAIASHSVRLTRRPPGCCLVRPVVRIQTKGRSVSRSRSSGVRARRAMRCSISCTGAEASGRRAPSVRPSRIVLDDGRRWRRGRRPGALGFRPASLARPTMRRRSRGRLAAGRARAERRPVEARSGCVCSSASLTSASSARRPTRRPDGERKRYRTRARDAPWRPDTRASHRCSRTRACRAPGG